MNELKPLLNKGREYAVLVLSLLITGIGVGWLAGLSVSPVVSIIITSVIGSAAALIAAASGITKVAKISVNPLPIAILVIGLVFGAVYGIDARTSNRFGRDIKDEVQRWRVAGLDLEEKDIVRRIFEHQYAIGETAGPGLSRVNDGFLSTTESEACSLLRDQEVARVRQVLPVSSVVSWRRLSEMVEDDEVLLYIVEEVLCSVENSN